MRMGMTMSGPLGMEGQIDSIWRGGGGGGGVEIDIIGA